MTRPAWAPECTCGETPRGYFCHECRAWAGSSYGEQASWSRPRAIFAQAQEAFREGDVEALAEAMGPAEVVAPKRTGVPGVNTPGVRCQNGRYSRPANAGEKLLPCGCPLVAAPRECIDAVAAKTVTVERRGLQH